MFIFVLPFYLYSSPVIDVCSLLSVDWKASNNRTMHVNYNSLQIN